MTPAAYEAHCRSLPAATKVVQWEGTSVFKVGGKMFAIANGFVDHYGASFMFKASDMAYGLLIEQGLARPAPYLARAKWVQLVRDDALTDNELRAYLDQAHALVAAKLTRAVRKTLKLP